jgi:hypothetical protein
MGSLRDLRRNSQKRNKFWTPRDRETSKFSFVDLSERRLWHHSFPSDKTSIECLICDNEKKVRK